MLRRTPCDQLSTAPPEACWVQPRTPPKRPARIAPVIQSGGTARCHRNERRSRTPSLRALCSCRRFSASRASERSLTRGHATLVDRVPGEVARTHFRTHCEQDRAGRSAIARPGPKDQEGPRRLQPSGRGDGKNSASARRTGTASWWPDETYPNRPSPAARRFPVGASTCTTT